jgi:dolichol-phosphate mannosyltransferase
VAPTYNEAAGITDLVHKVDQALEPSGINYELIIVDDNSPDGTADLAERLGMEFPVRVLRRPGKLGLSSAVTDGWKIAKGSVLGVIDADLSHDPKLLPSLLASITDGAAEVAVGSRYIPGGGMGNWPLSRQIVSQVAVWMGSVICPVKDVTSGYLLLRKEVLEGVHLNPIGFKIGLEILVRCLYRNFVEIPYTFQDRDKGQSKLSLKVIGQYLVQLGQLIIFSITNRQKRQRVNPVRI